MENSLKMKIFKYILLYIVICMILYLGYDYITFSQILLHYPYFDIRYLMFVGIQFYWVTLLYQVIFQYICLYTMMRTRLTYQSCLFIFMKQFILYSCLFLSIHCLIFFVIFRQIPIYLLLKSIVIYYLGFVFALILKKFSDYSYIFIIISILCIHFVV